MPTCLKSGISGSFCAANVSNRRIAASRTASCTSCMVRKTVKIGRAELPSAFASSCAVSAAAPFCETTSSAVCTISSFVNFGFGGIGHAPFVLKQPF